MKKKIAVFSSGWSGEFVQEILIGILGVSKAADTDVFTFLNFSVHSDNPDANTAEVNFFKLPDISEFDGVILLANTFNDSEELEYLKGEIDKYSIPTISVEYELENIPCISTDNYAGMHELAEYLITECGCNKYAFIGGPADHPENKERTRAFLDVLEENDIDIDEEDVYYADWGKTLISGIVDNYIARHGNLPDAFVCANDIMAIAAITYLEGLEYYVPDDVLVTGYDCIRFGQTRVPSVASVNHEWATMGKIAFMQLNTMINGGDVPEKTILKTKFVPGGTCGYSVKQHRGINHRDVNREGITNVLDPVDIDSHFRHFYSSIRKIPNKVELFHSFGYLFENQHDMEGEFFRICLDPAFFDVDASTEKLKKTGHSDIFDIACEIANGKKSVQSRCSKDEAIFGFARNREEPGLYVLLPLSSETYTYGFAILTGGFNAANDNQNYIWSRHMNQALEQLRSNLKLEGLNEKLRLLSVTDELTGLYNRMGFREYIGPMMLDHGKDGGECAVMLLDVDRMKVINDKYGHAAGDLALKIVTDVMKKELPEDFQISRFGGDEFCIGGKLTRQNRNIDKLIEKVDAALSEEMKKYGVEFELTVSIGYAKCVPKSVVDIEKAVAIADADMYERKAQHHKISR